MSKSLQDAWYGRKSLADSGIGEKEEQGDDALELLEGWEEETEEKSQILNQTNWRHRL